VENSAYIKEGLNDFATENKISPLSLERAQTTIYDWLRNYVKDMA